MHLKRRVVEPKPASSVQPSLDRFVNAAVPFDGVPTRTERQPVKVHPPHQLDHAASFSRASPEVSLSLIARATIVERGPITSTCAADVFGDRQQKRRTASLAACRR